MLSAFGIDINVKKIPKKDYSQIPIYIPSTGNITSDSLNIKKYKQEFNENATIIIFYLKDQTKNYEKWKSNLQGIESNGWIIHMKQDNQVVNIGVNIKWVKLLEIKLV